MSKGIKKKLSTRLILNSVSQADIFAHYLNKFIPTNTMTSDIIDSLADSGTRIRSPLRVDKNPSLGFRYSTKGKLRAKDFAGYFWGDCFDLVGYAIGVNVNKKRGFYNVLIHIVAELNINIMTGESEQEHVEINTELIRNHKHIFRVEARDWTDDDIDYWNKYHITIEFLILYNVQPINRFWVDEDSQPEPKYIYERGDKAYAYNLGKDALDITNWELYFPDRSRHDMRFMINASVIKGLINYHHHADTLILTKSYKDVIAIMQFLYKHFRNLYYKTNCLAAASESTYISKDKLDYLVRQHDRCISLMDFDRTGITAANHYRRYGFEPLFLTNGKFNTVNFYAKDFTDYLDRVGVTKLKKIMENMNKHITPFTTSRGKLIYRKFSLLKKDRDYVTLMTYLSTDTLQLVKDSFKSDKIININGINIHSSRALAQGKPDSVTEKQVKHWIESIDEDWINASYDYTDNTGLIKTDNKGVSNVMMTQPATFTELFLFKIGQIGNPPNVLVFKIKRTEYMNQIKDIFKTYKELSYETV